MTPFARRRTTWESREGCRAKAGDEVVEGHKNGTPVTTTSVDPVSRPAAGRTAAATSERMDVTSPGGENPAPTRVELPWPARALHPNSRSKHWGGRATAAKKARVDAAWEAKAAGLTKLSADSINACLTFHAPDNRRRDLDSMLASMKSALDGLADVIGVDDSRWSLSIRKAEPRPPHGAVIVEISVAA